MLCKFYGITFMTITTDAFQAIRTDDVLKEMASRSRSKIKIVRSERIVTKKNEKCSVLALPFPTKPPYCQDTSVWVRPQACIYATLVERSTEKI